MQHTSPLSIFDASIYDDFRCNLIWHHEHEAALRAADTTDKRARAVLDTHNDLDPARATRSQIIAFNAAVAAYKAARS